MALVIPDESYITVAEADAIIAKSLWRDKWAALSPEDKEAYLRIAFNHIQLSGAKIPDPVPNCIKEGQAETAIWDVHNNITAGAASNAGTIKAAKVGPIDVEYVEGTSSTTNVSIFPMMMKACLSELGANFGGCIRQGKVGRA